MSKEFQNRMYEMEVAPPPQVWEKLAATLDEINADNFIANKIQDATSVPPINVWGKIKDSFFENDKSVTEKKGIVINFKRFAAAAIFIGLIASAWFLFFNPTQKNENIAATKTPQVQENISTPVTSDNIVTSPDLENINQLTAENTITGNNISTKRKQDNFIYTSIVKAIKTEQPVLVVNNNKATVLEKKPGDKVFDLPIGDLTIISTDANYMTMVNANGRMVKIPANMAHLAPHLQNKPIAEDYFNILFGEGIFWNDIVEEWRQKLATSPVSSGDIFSNMVEMLKSVETN